MLILDGEEANKAIELGIGIEREGKVYLHPIEYYYLYEEGIVKEKIELEEKEKKLYKVFRFLYQRGYIPRISNREGVLRVGRKGYRRGEERTKYLIKVVDSLSLEEIKRDLELALKTRKKMVYGLVGEEIEFIKIDRKVFV